MNLRSAIFLSLLVGSNLAAADGTEQIPATPNQENLTTAAENNPEQDNKLAEQRAKKLSQDLQDKMGKMNKAIEQKISIGLDIGLGE